MSAWSCPHDLNGVCQKVSGARCDPDMRGCVLVGKVRFAHRGGEDARKPVRAPAGECPPAPPRRKLPF